MSSILRLKNHAYATIIVLKINLSFFLQWFWFFDTPNQSTPLQSERLDYDRSGDRTRQQPQEQKNAITYLVCSYIFSHSFYLLLFFVSGISTYILNAIIRCSLMDLHLTMSLDSHHHPCMKAIYTVSHAPPLLSCSSFIHNFPCPLFMILRTKNMYRWN